MTKLAIEGMEFYGFHGYYQEEQLSGGRYTVDVYIRLPSAKAGQTDQLKDTVNYEEIYRIAGEVMAEPVRLIEHLAHRILSRLQSELHITTRIKVRVRKHRPPLRGVVDQAYIELSSD